MYVMYEAVEGFLIAWRPFNERGYLSDDFIFLGIFTSFSFEWCDENLLQSYSLQIYIVFIKWMLLNKRRVDLQAINKSLERINKTVSSMFSL